jgi:hypothetical protein
VTSDDDWSDDQSEKPEESEEDQWDDMEDVIDSAMASATARFASGVSPVHLSKIWRISHEEAKRTLENTSHLLHRGQQTPSCQESTGLTTECSDTDGSKTISTWIPSLLLRRVESLAGDIAAASCLSQTKGFVYTVPMKRKGEVLLAMKQFAKEIGAPDAFVADMSG